MAKYDVVKEYDWTSSPRGSGLRSKAPRVWIRSYKIKSNQIMQTINSYIQLVEGKATGGNAKQFYDDLYGGVTEAEDDFNFPFFSDQVRSFGNSFGDTFQSGIGGGGGVLGGVMDGFKTFAGGAADLANITDKESVNNAAKFITEGKYKDAMNSIKTGGSPGTYVETPKFYAFNSDSDGSLPVEFVLSNTINSDFDKNYKLIKKLTEINRPLRKDGISVDPPRIYKVTVPGHRFIRWAYCDTFSVNLLGARRNINEKIVPEGYKITMSFKSLTLEHAGFMDEV